MSFIDIKTKAVALGTNYKTSGLLDDLVFNFTQLDSIINSYPFQFNNTNLVSGVLTVTHGKNTAYPIPLIRRPDGTYEDAMAIMTWVDVNTVTFDFGGSIATGTWIGLIRIGF